MSELPTDNFDIQHAAVDDTDAIQRVARASWHAAYDSLLGPETVEQRVDSWFDPERLVTDDIEPDDRPFLVARLDGRLVGFAEAILADTDGSGDEVAVVADLYRIYVDPDHWGEGVGSKLLERVESILRERGQDRVELSVLAENESAIGFYESNGFTRSGQNGDEQTDDNRIEYTKEL